MQVDELGAITRFEYGFYDLLTAQIGPDGARTEYRYDRARRLIEVVNPDGLNWRYAYFADGRLQSETDFNGATTTYRYDAAGRLAEKSNAEGQSIRYTYDAVGRPVAEITGAAEGSGAFEGEVTRFRYGADGEVSEASNAHGAGTYSYDVAFRVRVAVWDGQSVTASLNAAGQLVGVGSPSGVRTEYAYDRRGVLSGLTAAGRAVGLGSDAAGWITRAEVGRARVEREFDPVGRLLNQSWTASMEGRLFLGPTPAAVERVLTGSSFGYRPDGALSVRTVDQVKTRYRLDGVGRVNAVAVGGVVAERFGYDASDNIRTAVVGASGGAELWEYRGTLLVDDGRSRYSYDRAGRLVRTVTRRLNRKAEVWHYRWDAYDRLRSVTTPDGHSWVYGYDTAGRRTRKANVGTGEAVVFAWLGDQLLEQTATVGVGAGVTTSWCYLPGAVAPLAQVHAAVEAGVDVPLRVGGAPAVSAVCEGRMSWSQPDVDRAFYALVTDHLGTPTHVIDPASARVAGRASSGLWGQTTWTGEVSTPLRFPGQYFDGETGWHYNRYRYYHPATGRYCTADPLGLAPAPNPYGYPRNPTVETDPLGLMPCKPAPLRQVLKAWVNQSFTFGNVKLLMDQKDLEHILTRHHLHYWDGSAKPVQTFFAGSPTPKELLDAISDILYDNRDMIVNFGSRQAFQIEGRVNGMDHIVGIFKGHIHQFYPVAK
ncbi:RHS repeat protein [Mycobacterium camsae]|uniref:RHS repeat protein n=1 Tax=Mycobacterium gordonae TaxID=1778 RepID=UPI00197E6CA3|nr:RHS repeat protein [Mycobacterium gordonae]